MTAVTASSAARPLPPARRCRSRTARCQSAARIGPEPTGVRGSRPDRAASLMRAFDASEKSVSARHAATPSAGSSTGGGVARRRSRSRPIISFRAASSGARSVTGSSRIVSGSVPCPLIVSTTSGAPWMRRAAHIVPWRQTSASPIGSVSRV